MVTSHAATATQLACFSTFAKVAIRRIPPIETLDKDSRTRLEEAFVNLSKHAIKRDRPL